MTNKSNTIPPGVDEKGRDDTFWKITFKYMMDQMGKLLGKEGKSLHAYNVEAHWDPEPQYCTFMDTVEKLRDKDDCIVTSSLPGGERIFWPYYGTQFYIRDKEKRVYFKGNSEIIQYVLDIPEEKIHSIIPKLDFWKEHTFTYYVDTTRYTLPQKGTSKALSSSEAIVNYYKYMRATPLINTEWWYLLKFFFMASWYGKVDDDAEFIGGVPKALKIKCECGKLVPIDHILRGLFKIQEFNVEHDYCLYIGDECDDCGKIVCVYRPKDALCTPLIPYMNFLTDKDTHMEDKTILTMWHFVLAEATLMGEKGKIEELYKEDFVKYGMFFVNKNKE